MHGVRQVEIVEQVEKVAGLVEDFVAVLERKLE
jgi:hypothetical protein